MCWKVCYFFMALFLLFFVSSSVWAEAPDGFVLVKAGSFIMGSSEGHKDERPEHEVKITRDFYMSKYEVTFEEYDRFCEDTGRDKPDDEGWGRGDRPVIYVSWFDTLAYCNWRSEQEGLEKCYVETNDGYECRFTANGYRLPTEAEWEFAASNRGRKPDYIYAGSDNLKEVAWFFINSRKTHPVGELKPNKLGLYDMSGNVREFCWDWYAMDFYEMSPVGDPTGPLSGQYRVQRGGSWDYNQDDCRIANRAFEFPAFTFNHIGFRVVRNAE